MLILLGVHMPASIRIIKIVKDPTTQEDAYTVELEIEGERSKDLRNEILTCPMGNDLIELLNRANFLPTFSQKSPEELKEEAKKEEEEREQHEKEIKEEAQDELFNKIIDVLIRLKKFKDEATAKETIKKEMEKEAVEEEKTEGDNQNNDNDVHDREPSSLFGNPCL